VADISGEWRAWVEVRHWSGDAQGIHRPRDVEVGLVGSEGAGAAAGSSWRIDLDLKVRRKLYRGLWDVGKWLVRMTWVRETRVV